MNPRLTSKNRLLLAPTPTLVHSLQNAFSITSHQVLRDLTGNRVPTMFWACLITLLPGIVITKLKEMTWDTCWPIWSATSTCWHKKSILLCSSCQSVPMFKSTSPIVSQIKKKFKAKTAKLIFWIMCTQIQWLNKVWMSTGAQWAETGQEFLKLSVIQTPKLEFITHLLSPIYAKCSINRNWLINSRVCCWTFIKVRSVLRCCRNF